MEGMLGGMILPFGDEEVVGEVDAEEGGPVQQERPPTRRGSCSDSEPESGEEFGSSSMGMGKDEDEDEHHHGGQGQRGSTGGGGGGGEFGHSALLLQKHPQQQQQSMSQRTGNSDSSDTDSDSDDEEEAEAPDPYRRKYHLLLERCDVLQEDNERLMHRLQTVRKTLKAGRRHRRFLMTRLDLHGDNWREAALAIPLIPEEEDEPPQVAHTEAPHKRGHQRKGHAQQTPPGGRAPKKRTRSKKPRGQQELSQAQLQAELQLQAQLQLLAAGPP